MPAEIVILADHGDPGAAAAAMLLRRRGRVRPPLFDGAALASARFVHHPSSGPVAASGAAPVSLPADVVEFGSADTIDAGTGAVWCRLSTVGAARLPVPDQDYGDAEMFAGTLSWLAGLGDRIINRPRPASLAGTQVDAVELHALAEQVGLSAPDLVLRTSEASAPPLPAGLAELERRRWDGLTIPTKTLMAESRCGPPLPVPVCWEERLIEVRTVLVAGGDAGAAPPGVEGQLIRLAAAAGLDLCECTIGRRRGGQEWLVAGLSPVPTLSRAADVIRCVQYLERRACHARDVAA